MVTNRVVRQPDQREANHAETAAYFAAVHDTFLQAGQAGGGFVDRFYMIGGYTIQLRFAGPALMSRITPALEHLKAPSPHAAPALTVCLWDSASTGATPPPPVWEASDPGGRRGEVPGYNDERFSTAIFNYSGRNTLSILDRESDLALFWVPDELALPYWEIAAPMFVLLNWWMSDHARRMVHGGAVGISSGAVLLAGQGGAGKSTTTLSCLLSGLLYLGDDYVLLGAEPDPFVHSLYSSAKLHHEGLTRFPQLLPTVSRHRGGEDDEKAVLLLHDHFGERIETGLPLRAILVPCITGLARTQLRSASAAISLLALAPNTIFQLPGTGQAAFRQIAQFVEQVPKYTLELGRNVHEVPRVISQLLSELEDDRLSKLGRKERSS